MNINDKYDLEMLNNLIAIERLNKNQILQMVNLVSLSVDLIIVCPTKLIGFPEIASAKTISLLIYSADDGFIKYFSKSSIVGVSLYRTLNNILKDSSVPFDWYNDFEFFIKLLTSKLLTKSTFSKPGVSVDFVFL